MKSKQRDDLQGFEGKILPALLQAVEERRDATVETIRRAPTQPRRSLPRRRLLSVAVVLCAALGLAIVLPALSDDPRRGAIAIGKHGDYFYLRVEDAAANPEAMTHDLRAAGLDARVELVPVSQSLVGMWVDVANDSTTGYNDPRIVDLFEQMYPEGDPSGIPQARVLVVPADFETPISLQVGRATNEEEQWLQSHGRDSPDETQPGGIVYCVRDLDPPQADRILSELGYENDWRVLDPVYPSSEGVAEPPAGKVITYAQLLGPDILAIDTADPDTRAGLRALQEHAADNDEC